MYLSVIIHLYAIVTLKYITSYTTSYAKHTYRR